MTWLLFFVSAVSYLDRQVFGLLIEPMQREFGFTDLEIGLVTGLTFALFYALGSLPSGFWSIRGNRRNLIVATTIFWGIMTAAGGFATVLWHLVIARAGVAFAEAAGVPAAHSILTSGAGRENRASRFGIFVAGAPFGALLSFAIGGVIGQIYGWRVAFITAGVPAVILGVIALMFREPKRTAEDTAKQPAQYSAIIASILKHTNVRLLIAAEATNQITISAALSWYPVYLVRIHGFTLQQAALLLLGGACAAVLGTLITSRFSDYLTKRNYMWRALSPAIYLVIAQPFVIAFLLADWFVIAILAFILPATLAISSYAPTISLLHESVDPQYRPVASSLLMTTITVVGIGLGPSLVGAASTLLFSHLEQGLRYALLSVQVFSVISALLYFAVAGRLRYAAPI